MADSRRSWIPHITLAYTAEGEHPVGPLAEPIPVTFDAITVAAGERQWTYPLTGEPESKWVLGADREPDSTLVEALRAAGFEPA